MFSSIVDQNKEDDLLVFENIFIRTAAFNIYYVSVTKKTNITETGILKSKGKYLCYNQQKKKGVKNLPKTLIVYLGSVYLFYEKKNLL